MCVTVYHDLNVCYYGVPMLNKKTEVATIFFTDVTDFDNEQKMYLCILTQATIKCAFLRYKKVI